MAKASFRDLEELGAAVEWVDLAETELPLCDGGAAYGHENVIALSDKIIGAAGIIVATPIYNFDVNATLKNLIELTGRHWTGKVVGFLCAAGGQASYMSIMALANSLMLDFRCVIVPRFVYATSAAFEGSEIADSELRTRVTRLAKDVNGFSKALTGLTEEPPER